MDDYERAVIRETAQWLTVTKAAVEHQGHDGETRAEQLLTFEEFWNRKDLERVALNGNLAGILEGGPFLKVEAGGAYLEVRAKSQDDKVRQLCNGMKAKVNILFLCELRKLKVLPGDGR